MAEIWETASKFLANRMKTKNQLKTHLESKQYPENEITDILSQFEESGYLDDIEYAAVYIAHRIPKGHTYRRIKRELLELGISDDQIEDGLSRFVEEHGYDPTADELQRGKREAEKIIGNQREIDNKLLARTGRKLVSLGYRSETIYAILGEYMRGTRE